MYLDFNYGFFHYGYKEILMACRTIIIIVYMYIELENAYIIIIIIINNNLDYFI